MRNDKEKPSNLVEYEHSIDPRLKALIAIMTGLTGTIILAWILGGPLSPIMDKIKDTWVYHFIPFIFSFSFFGVLTYKATVKGVRGLNFLSGAVLLHGIAEFLNMIDSGKGELFNRGDNYIAAVADLLFPIALILLYMHVELIEKLRPGLLHAIGIIGTAAPLIIGGIMLIVFEPFKDDVGFYDNIQDVVLIYLGVFALVIFWISLFGLRVMYQTMRHADSKDISNGSILVLIGFASLLTNFLLLSVSYSSSITDKTILFDENFTIHNSWLLTFALFIMLAAYILNPKFAYSVPFDVYQLLVINSEMGITLYSFVNEFRTEGNISHSALKSSAIVAIQNLVQEIAHAEGHIIIIGMSDRILILKSHKQIVSVLISEKNSYFINKGLEDFTKKFYESFEEDIVNFTGNVGVFHPAKDLISHHLPFMREESLLETLN